MYSDKNPDEHVSVFELDLKVYQNGFSIYVSILTVHFCKLENFLSGRSPANGMNTVAFFLE